MLATSARELDHLLSRRSLQREVPVLVYLVQLYATALTKHPLEVVASLDSKLAETLAEFERLNDGMSNVWE